MGALISTKTRALDAAIKAAQAAMATAEAENRLMTPEERADVDAKMAEARKLGEDIEQARKQEALAAELTTLSRGVGDLHAPAVGQPAGGGRVRLASLGEQLVTSEAYKAIASAASRSGEWRGPSAELDFATTLDPEAASGGDLLVPQYLPGIQQLLFRRRSVLALFPTGTTSNSSIQYFEEASFTNAAAPTAHSTAKPESALTFNSVNEPVRKVPHWLPVADEMLEDVPALRGFVDARLRLGLDLTIEDQVLNGNGTSPNISGLLDRTLATAVTQGASEPLVDAIHRQITALSFSSFVIPDAIVMNPNDWETIALSKDANDRYFGAGPFSPQPPVLWGLPVVVSPIIAQGTILVGGFALGCQIFYRTGVTVAISNSHSDYFVKNITAIRAERRLALAVYRPTGFGEVEVYVAP